MMARAGSSILPGRWAISCLGSLRLNGRCVILAGLVASSFIAYQPVYADEFDVLAVYSGRDLSTMNGRCAPPPMPDIGSDPQTRQSGWPPTPSVDATKRRTG